MHHVSPQRTVGRCEEAQHVDLKEAVHDEDLVCVTTGVPPVPHVDGRKVGRVGLTGSG